MKIEIVYPPKDERRFQRHDLIRMAMWPFLFAAYICPILNIAIGGTAWSLVVVWSLRMVWSFTFSPELVEINRISLFVKLITNTSILLLLIELFISPGWAVVVVPIVCFGGLAVSGTLFFTDIDKQKQNMMPMLMFTTVAIIASIMGILIWRRNNGLWVLAVMGAFAFALLVSSAKVLGSDFIREIKRRFHTR